MMYNPFMNETEIEQDAPDKDPEPFIRSLEIEVFGEFMARALSIVRKQEEHTSIADACRLVDAALKAARGDASMPDVPVAGDNGLRGLIEELHTGYEELRAAQPARKATSGENER